MSEPHRSNTSNSTVVPESVALDIFVISLRMETGLHAYLFNPGSVDSERILFAMFHHGRVLEDLRQLRGRLRLSIEGQLNPAILDSIDDRAVPWPPSHTPSLPAQADLGTVADLASHLPRTDAQFVSMAVATALFSVIEKFSPACDVTDRQLQSLKKSLDYAWRVFWGNYDGQHAEDLNDSTPKPDNSVAEVRETLASLGDCLAGKYTTLALDGVEPVVSQPQDIDGQTLVVVSSSIVALGEFAASVPLDPMQQWWSPTIAPPFEHPAQVEAWSDVRAALRRVEAGFRSNDAEERKKFRENEKRGYYNVSAVLSDVDPSQWKYFSDGGFSPQATAEPQEDSITSCADYTPGDLKLTEKEATSLYKKLSQVISTVHSIVTNYATGDFTQELFYRVAMSPEYDDVWGFYWFFEELRSTHWPDACSAQIDTLHQLAGQFTVSDDVGVSLERWGGWEEPMPVPYCDDCDPEGRHVDYPS